MVTVPEDTPVTTPEVPTVAIEVLPLLHVPHDVASERAEVLPTHALVVPVMADMGSLIVIEVLFHLSPASSVPLLFTAFTVP